MLKQGHYNDGTAGPSLVCDYLESTQSSTEHNLPQDEGAIKDSIASLYPCMFLLDPDQPLMFTIGCS